MCMEISADRVVAAIKKYDGGGLISVLNLPLTLINKAFLNRALAGLCAVRVHILWGWSSVAWWPNCFFLTAVSVGMHLFCLC